MDSWDQTTRAELHAARNQLTKEGASRLLRSIIKNCTDLLAKEESPEALRLKALALSELAREQQNPFERDQYWQDALRQFSDMPKGHIEFDIVVTRAEIAAGYFQDNLSAQDRLLKQPHLLHAKREIDREIEKYIGEQRAELLRAKSSLIRQEAILEASPKRQSLRLQEADRCIGLATKISPSPGIILEGQLIAWALARQAPTDAAYSEALKRIEHNLLSREVQAMEPGRLALARFYRETFRPLEACNAFETVLDKITQARRVYRDAYVYSEAATSLWWSEYPNEIVSSHVRNAKLLVERAIAGGNLTARMVTGLAFLTAISDGVDAATTSLRDIYDSSKGLNWERALNLVSTEDRADILRTGFAIGIDEGGVWTRLGTFAKRFLQNDKFAENLYRTAARLSPHDPVCLTNLARLLVKKRDPESLSEAERYLQKAKNFADKRFVWWRNVEKELQVAKGMPPLRSYADGEQVRIDTVDDIAKLRREYRRFAESNDLQSRGHGLELLICRLAQITFGIASASYHVKREASGVIREVDGFLEHKSQPYRIECKWRSQQTGQNDIVLFANKLDAAGVAGLFVSMSGFHETAVAQARELREDKVILFVDGDEVEALFDKRILLDELISIKRTRFNQYSDSWFKVSASADRAEQAV